MSYSAIGTAKPDDSLQEFGNTNPKVENQASAVSFDPSGTGMSATNVQSAIGELNSNLSELSKSDLLSSEGSSSDVNYLFVSAKKHFITIFGTTEAYSAAGVKVMGTIKSSYLPVGTAYTGITGSVRFAAASDADSNGLATCYIDLDGSIKVYSEKATSYGMYFTITYVV